MTDRVLTTVSLLASDMAGRWQRWVNNMAALAEGHDSTIGSGRGSGHADPTATTAASWVDSVARAEDLRAQLLITARELDAEISRIPADQLDPKAVKLARCSGEIDPTCTRNAVRSGLCWACIKRQQRTKADPTTVLVDPKQPSTRQTLTAEEAARRITQGQSIAGLDALQLAPDYVAGQTLANQQAEEGAA